MKKRKILFICLDACSPKYLEFSALENINRLIKNGFYIIGSSVIPTVTNVNNVSIITGEFPSIHGITGNYFYERQTDSYKYMESAEYILCPTLLEKAKEKGMITALLTSKAKLLTLLQRGADIAVTAENPPAWLVKIIGPSADVYSADINIWLFKAAMYLIKSQSPDLIYLSTTDYIMHKYPSEHQASIKHLRQIDNLIGEIHELEPEREIYITADHGMNTKRKAINIERWLKEEGIQSKVVPIIKDKYVVHHQNLGGAAYIYLAKQGMVKPAIKILEKIKGIEEVYSREEAIKKFHLLGSRIGDLFILGDRETVFGEVNNLVQEVNIRSHGSRYESAVPIIGYPRKANIPDYKMNIDLTRFLGI